MPIDPEDEGAVGFRLFVTVYRVGGDDPNKWSKRVNVLPADVRLTLPEAEDLASRLTSHVQDELDAMAEEEE